MGYYPPKGIPDMDIVFLTLAVLFAMGGYAPGYVIAVALYAVTTP